MKILLNLPLIMLSLMMSTCDDTRHLNAIFKTGPRATNVVLAGDLVPAGAVLVTPALETSECHCRCNHTRILLCPVPY